MINQNKLYLGEKIKAQRKRLKLTQFELAEKAGLHEKQISRIEAGLNHPTFDNFLKLIFVLGLDMSDFDFKDKKADNPLKDDLKFIINNSTTEELKTYLDVINAVKKNIK